MISAKNRITRRAGVSFINSAQKNPFGDLETDVASVAVRLMLFPVDVFAVKAVTGRASAENCVQQIAQFRPSLMWSHMLAPRTLRLFAGGIGGGVVVVDMRLV